MPIDSVHPEFNPQLAQVTLDAYNADVLDYIPRLKRQNAEDYEAYRQRGVYFNVTKRTTEAMIGAAMRKPIVSNLEDPFVSENITLGELASQAMRTVITQGRGGLLVDWDDQEQKPKIVLYDRANITNWRRDMSLIVLRETIYEDSDDDPYTIQVVEQYRECAIDRDTGFYVVRLWRKKSAQDKARWVVVDEVFPTIRGENLTQVPFTFVNPFDTTDASHNPVVLNIAQLNISHFKTTVDIEHGCHFTALPQPWVAGEFSDDQGTEIGIGSEFVWLLEQDAKVGYLEFTGSGLKSLENRLEHKEQQMVSQGSQLLSQRNGVESAEALRIRSGAETATLMNVVQSVESAIRQALRFYVMWLGIDPSSVEFEMNRDFSARELTPQEMSALMQLYLNGTISQETFLENLFEGEIAPAVVEEMRRLASQRLSQGERDNEDEV